MLVLSYCRWTLEAFFGLGWFKHPLQVSRLLPLLFLSHRIFSLLNPATSFLFNLDRLYLDFSVGFLLCFKILFFSLYIVIGSFQFIRVQVTSKQKLLIQGQIKTRLPFHCQVFYAEKQSSQLKLSSHFMVLSHIATVS